MALHEPPLELAVSDVVDEVQSVNHFKAFMEKIHNLYSQSSKNSQELLEAAQEVGSQVLKIGRVLNTRWVASSFRAVKAVWGGLAHGMQSKEFLCDLGLMYDALSELANLSQQLQTHLITLLRAEQLLKRTIRVLTSFSRREIRGGIELTGFGTFWIGFTGVKCKAHPNQRKAVPTKSDQHLGEAPCI